MSQTNDYQTLDILVEGDDPSYADIDWNTFVASLQVYLIQQGYSNALVWIPGSDVTLIRGRVEDSNGNVMIDPPSVAISGISIDLNPDGTFTILMPDGTSSDDVFFSNPEDYECVTEDSSEVDVLIVCTTAENTERNNIIYSIL